MIIYEHYRSEVGVRGSRVLFVETLTQQSLPKQTTNEEGAD